MNILFVLRNKIMCESLGTMYLSAIAKKGGCGTDLVYIDSDNVDSVMQEFKPDIVAYSIHTGEHKHLIKFNQELKQRYDFLSLFGGPHPTFFPEMIHDKGVDVVCVGEGEDAFEELLNAKENNKPINNFIKKSCIKST